MSDVKNSTCPGCGCEITLSDSTFCTQCGARLPLQNTQDPADETSDATETQSKTCTQCGEAILYPEANFCTECGAELAIQGLPSVPDVVKVKQYIKTGRCIHCGEEITADAVDTCTHCGFELPAQKFYSGLVESPRFVTFIMLLTWCKPLALLLAFAVVETSSPHDINLEIINISALFGGVFADWRWTKPLMSLFFLYYVYLLNLLIAKKRLFVWHFILATLLPTSITFWWMETLYTRYSAFEDAYKCMLIIQIIVCAMLYTSHLAKTTFGYFDQARRNFRKRSWKK